MELIIRNDQPYDIPLIRDVNAAAFDRSAEAGLVDALRENNTISLLKPLSKFACVLALWAFPGLLLFQTLLFTSSVRAGTQRTPKSVESKRLVQAIHLSANYLVKRCDQNGRFLYRINMDPDVTPKPKYNFLRHAGTMYALSQYEHAYPNAQTVQTLERAALFLKKASIAPIPERFAQIPDRHALLIVWSTPFITGLKKPVQAKLGGTGLGLVALLSLEKQKPGTTPLDYLRQMGNFLLYMQKKDGSFYSKYYPHHGGKSDKWTSLYYPGEAALGLVMLYEKDPDPIWLQAAANAMAYLVRLRAAKPEVPADHWALLATAKLLPLYDRSRQPVSKAAILKHAVQICETILSTKPHNPQDSLQYGGFSDDGRTTPTAIRLEGLLAALTFLPDEHIKLKKQIINNAEAGIGFLLRSQIISGEYAGAIPRAIRPLPEAHPRFNKAFNRRATEVRIDYVQHALSAMLHYRQLFF